MSDRRPVSARVVVADPARLRRLTAARKELLACVRDPALRERLDGEIDVVAFRDGIVVRVHDTIDTLVSANDSREAAE